MRATVPYEPDSRAMVSSTDGAETYAQKMALRLSPSRFCCVWVAVAAMRCVCFLFHFNAVRLYQLLSARELEWYMNFLSPNVGELFPPAALLFALLGFAHVAELALMIVHSIRARQLVFTGPSFLSSRVAALRDRYRRCVSRPSRFGTPKWLERTSSRVSSLHGEVSVTGQYFKIKFLLRESVEMISQTVQAYQSSALIARAWINHIYVAALFVNSWSTPVVEHVTRHSEALERVACLAVDLTLDAVMSIALPVLIVLPHIGEFDRSTMMFDPAAVYTLRSFNRFIMESRQVLAHDRVDLIMKVIPHISILGCLRSIQTLVCRSSVKVAHGQRRETEPATKSGPRKSNIPDTPSAAGRLRHLCRVRNWIALLHAVFILWGGAILCVHLVAISRSSNGEDGLAAGCMQQLHPWFTEKTACSIYKYDCGEHSTSSPSEDWAFWMRRASCNSCSRTFQNSQCPPLFNNSEHFWELTFGDRPSLNGELKPRLQAPTIPWSTWAS